MTVKEIFELRKQGKVQEAWQGIQPLYAEHQGHYTTLAMFWTTHDMAALFIKNQQTDQARKLLFQLTKIYPNIDDKDHKAVSAIVSCALKLDDLIKNFNLIYFLPYFQIVADTEWKNQKINGHYVESLPQRVVNHLFRNIEERATEEYIRQVMPLFSAALQHNPKNRNNLMTYARLSFMNGEEEKGKETLRHLALKYHDAKAAEMMVEHTQDDVEKISWLCLAINNQKQEKFRSKLRVKLAGLLMQRAKPHALCELKKSREVRTALGYHVPEFALQMEQQLADVTPASENQHINFYLKMINRLHYFACILLVLVLTACGTSKSSEQKTLEKEKVVQCVNDSLNSGRYTVNFNYVHPQRFPSKALTSSYFVRMDGDSLSCFLPYFGVAHQADFSNESPLNFNARVYEMDSSKPKKDLRRISFSAKHNNELFHFILEVFDNGNASLKINAMERDPIEFTGELNLY